MTNEELIAEARECLEYYCSENDTSTLLRDLADALEAATTNTEWGVRFLNSEGYEEPVWLAEDQYEARAEAMGHDGKMMTRTVGPWGVCE